MTKTNISYNCAKKIIDFMGDLCPCPMDKEWYHQKSHFARLSVMKGGMPPAYKLHDLLSKEFLESFHLSLWKNKILGIYDISLILYSAYRDGRGLIAVESAIINIMEDRLPNE